MMGHELGAYNQKAVYRLLRKILVERIAPGPGQESVWDYPRPPRLEPTPKSIRIIFNDLVLVKTQNAQRVLETSHPPTYYIPPTDVCMEYLHPTTKASWCEWKGKAQYFTIVVGERQAPNAAWCYPDPTPQFRAIAGYLAFYAHLMDACFVDEELVDSQTGDFYGGWITQDIVGPFKGGPGTWGW